MEGLFARLTEYGASQYYPFHMPGHKRNMPEEIGALQGIAELDITEIEGFDDLHAPDGILKEAQEKAAAVFGAEETFFLVNGSTAGILTAVSAAAPRGSRIIMARNCHKSVYHACFLGAGACFSLSGDGAGLRDSGLYPAGAGGSGPEGVSGGKGGGAHLPYL